MELAAGEGLDAMIGCGAVPVSEAIEIAGGIAAGLAAAHAPTSATKEPRAIPATRRRSPRQ